MLDNYTAYLSSLPIHLEQMKTSYQLEGVCCNPLSTPSLSALQRLKQTAGAVPASTGEGFRKTSGAVLA